MGDRGLRIGVAYRYRPWSTGDFLRRSLEKACITWIIDSQYVKGAWPLTWNDTYARQARLNAIVAVGLQDGVDPSIRTLEIPKVFWTMDDPLSIDRNLALAPLFDHVFVAQKSMLDRYLEVNPSCSWLPFGCDRDIHYGDVFHLHRESFEHDICFVGHTYASHYEKREEWMSRLGQDFRVKITTNVYLKELADLYHKGPMVYNNSFATDLNMRVFEAMACGRLLITDKSAEVNGLLDLFEDGKHLVTYNDFDDLKQKVGYYLEHLEEAAMIAQQGMYLVHSDHTYDKIAITVLDKIWELYCDKYGIQP